MPAGSGFPAGFFSGQGREGADGGGIRELTGFTGMLPCPPEVMQK